MELLTDHQHILSHTRKLYYHCANQTQKHWARDNAAALRIQSKFKMYMKRKAFLQMKAAAIRIETQFRAHYARKQFRAKEAAHNNLRNLQYFSQQAVVIQKWFRGFFQRKYKHNFYLRKSELKALEQKNELFRQELTLFGQTQAVEAEEYQRQIAKAEFQTLAKNLHHLSSTKGIPGVYNSPFVADKPTVFDKPVEQHLKEVFKSAYKWKPLTKQQILAQSVKSKH